jgi:flavorubredoxin
MASSGGPIKIIKAYLVGFRAQQNKVTVVLIQWGNTDKMARAMLAAQQAKVSRLNCCLEHQVTLKRN